jgi:uncharacterized protein (TIGR02001 family)
MRAVALRWFCLGILLWAGARGASAADLTLSVTGLSDFRFRGVSLSDRDPAVQAGVDWSHAQGAMAGALISTVRPGPSPEKESGVAGLGYLGWSGVWTGTLTWSGGFLLYAFPHQPQVDSLDYQEVFLRLRAADAELGLYVSNSYFDSGAPSAYLSVAIGRDLTDRLRLFAHAGWLGTGSANADYSYYDHTQRFDARVGASFDLNWASIELSVVGATESDNWCRADRRACEVGLVFGIRAQF